ncbi:MAG: DUF1223 domain-containing protein [Magnetospirillum sp. WYHS-4]
MGTRTEIIVAALLLMPWSPLSGLRAEERSATVVELFTSQGCSSCPPADAYLSELAGRPEVLALSFHVDYWDYLGWKDPYATPDNTHRQRNYAKLFNLPYVYTPQMVVAGAVQTAGTDRTTVDEALLRRREREARSPAVELRRQGPEEVIARLPALTGSGAGWDLWLVAYDDEHLTQVRRGENQGRTIRNRNVVRGVDFLGSWEGGAGERRIVSPRSPSAGLALLVQDRETGRIEAVGRLDPVTKP